MGLKSYWTTREGEKITYDKLSDAHLKNIIKDGYRNPDIIAEAKARKFKIPTRPVDKLDPFKIMAWVESFNSCAIFGNELAIKMSELLDKNPALFLLNLNVILEQIEKEDKKAKAKKNKIQGRRKPDKP